MNEDFEYEARKYYIYWMERQMEIEQNYYSPEYGVVLTDLNYELQKMESN